MLPPQVTLQSRRGPTALVVLSFPSEEGAAPRSAPARGPSGLGTGTFGQTDSHPRRGSPGPLPLPLLPVFARPARPRILPLAENNPFPSIVLGVFPLASLFLRSSSTPPQPQVLCGHDTLTRVFSPLSHRHFLSPDLPVLRKFSLFLNVTAVFQFHSNCPCMGSN